MANHTSHNQFFGRMELAALAVGLLAALVAGGIAFVDRTEIMNAYLWGYLYWWSATLGCFGWAVIFHLTGGAWGVATRPFVDAGVRTLPLLAILFLPIALNLDVLFAWMDPEYFSGREHVESRRWYLSESFFLARAATYFIILLLLSVLLPRRTRDDHSVAQSLVQRSSVLGGIGALLLVLIVSFAAIDWGMSLDPEWYSTLYGGFFIAGSLLLSLCVVAGTATLELGRLADTVPESTELRHDFGKLMLALLMVWAYFAFSQYLIVYAGNLPMEAVWYEDRREGIWPWVAWGLIVLHFAFPFAALLSRDIKRNGRSMVMLAAYLGFIHLLDVLWLIVPSLDFAGDGWWALFCSLTTLTALSGLWMFEYLRQIRRRFVPVIPFWPVPNPGDRSELPSVREGEPKHA
jgi:hypothetical protein